ncbi:MAG: Rieske (2Fe-2S) protein [Planctomycetota bacterium]|jgi:3-phenylpropionate/trans-cinnamate dioxygenase ferredoxin subunit
MSESKDRQETSFYVPVGRVEDFPNRKGKCVDVAGKPVAVFNLDGEFYALHDRCTHADAPLSRGTVKGSSVMCPRHGAHFDLKTGAVMTLQAVQSVEAFEVKVEDGEVLVGTRGSIEEPMWVTGRRLDEDAPESDPDPDRA